MASGILYIVSTPIGNLEDITLRALRVLKECDLIAAEDTRVTRKLLSHFDIHTPLTSYHRHSRVDKALSILARLAEGASIALVSDAGTPAVSDPGAELVQRAASQGTMIVPVPGASAVLSALVSSGLPTGCFAFDGFPPRATADRRAFFDALKLERRTIILFESPVRFMSTMEAILACLGDRRIAIAREVTKRFEEVFRGTVTQAINRYCTDVPRGELTLVVEGLQDAAPTTQISEADLERALRSALEEGLSGRDAVRKVSVAHDLPRGRVYTALLRLAGSSDSAE